MASMSADAHGSAEENRFGAAGVPSPEGPPRRAARLDAPGGGHASASAWLASRGLPRPRLAAAAPAAKTQGFPAGAFAVANHVDAVSPTENLDSASIAYNPSRGEYLVVWHAFVRETATDIYGRRLSASGSPIGAAFVICDAAGVQAVPHVAYESTTGTYWVTWSDFRNGDIPDVMVRRVSGTGSLVGSEIQANGPVNEAFASRIACGSGRCVVTWQNVEADGDSHVLIQGYEASGATFVPILLLTDAVGVAAEPDICYNPTDQHFTLAWQTSNGSNWDVSMFVLNRDLAGVAWGPVSTASGHQGLVRIAYSPGAGRYLVVWQDSRSQQTWDVYGQLVGRDGALSGSPLAIYAGSYHDTDPVVVAHSSSSEFVVSFQRDISGAEQYQVYGARVSGSGSVGQAFPIRLWYNIRWSPALAQRTGSSEYIAAWTDLGSGIQNDIQAQRFRSDGTLTGSLVNVSVGRKGQETPSTAYNTRRDEYLTVWADYRSGSDYDVYARLVSSSGALLDQAILVASESFLYGVPEVAYNANTNEYLVVWQEVTSPSTGYEIYGQRLSAVGDLRGNAFHISRDTNTVNEGMPVVAYNPVAREYLVAWHAFTSSLWRIWGQRVAESGQLIGGNFVVNGSNGDANAPRIVHNPARNEYVVVWADFRNNRADVYGQRLTGTGARTGSDLAISTASGDKGRCDIDYNAADATYLVVWGDNRNPTSDIYGQMLGSGANLSGPAFSISASDYSEVAPLVSWDPVSNRFLVAWWEYHDATDYDVWACTVSGAGTVAGDWVPVTDAPEVQRAAKLSRGTTNGTMLVVWQDFRNGNYDIYGRLWKASGCGGDAETLCLNDGRFAVTVEWEDFEGKTGAGQAVPLTSDTGYFWFFRDTNLELMIKVLDGTGVNGYYWVIFGALSNVEYTITVEDTETGATVTYYNPSGNFASHADTAALPGGGKGGKGGHHLVEVPASGRSLADAELYTRLMAMPGGDGPVRSVDSCSPGSERLCLNSSRFAVEVDWSTTDGRSGHGRAVSLTSDTGYFWFFKDTNVELVVKVLNGRSLNGYYWVFYGALSDVDYTITVTDTQTGATRTYHNPQGQMASVGDTEAFYVP